MTDSNGTDVIQRNSISPTVHKTELTPTDLDALTGVAQCLDDQWAPPDIIDRAAVERASLSEFAPEIQHATRTEFFKSLLTMKSVVINRAYLLHNETIKQLYLNDGSDAETFARFMDNKTMIPFLFDERQLSHFSGSKLSKDVENYWIRAEQAGTRKLRLSWNDKTNLDLISDHIATRYGQFFKTIDDLKPHLLKRDFSLSHDDDSIKRVFRQIRNYANEVADETGRPVKRKEIYRKFVCDDSLHEDTLVIDQNKPFARQIKALADLKYNVNLPDVLNRYVVTSQGSISRECLQELKDMTTEKFPTIDDRELSDLLLAVAGIALDAVNRSVEITDIGSVSLGDILAVREDPIWDAHHGIAIEHLPDRTKPYSSQKFVKDPLDSMSKISNSLGNVVTRLGQIQKRRRLFDAVERWEIRFSALGVFEMIASEAGHAFFGLPHLPSDPISEHSLTKGTIPIVAHAVVFLEGGGLKYEIKQPVFQGKMWAEQAANVAQEVRRRLSFNGTEIAPSGDQARPDQQGGGIEVKDQDD